ncbi:MAG: hypothetical protein NXH72_12510 [Hyphomonadaceae bacterium]|nr:hypothetical protein [Hyphomonadaceae bacterium]
MTLKSLTAIAVVFALGACATSLQTTSGADYLARYDASHEIANGAPTDVDDDVRRIAAIEPNLNFPARIGLARIDRGALTALPVDEARIWQDLAAEMGPDYGEFVPVSPLIASMVGEPAAPGMDRAAAIIANIRRGAARQHLDYVLTYEVGSSHNEKANALALADLTIIGMFVLPSRTIEVEATANGLLLDVRTGYPYATLTTHAEKSGISRAVSEWSTSLDYADTAEERAVAELAEEFGESMDALVLRALQMANAG